MLRLIDDDQVGSREWTSMRVRSTERFGRQKRYLDGRGGTRRPPHWVKDCGSDDERTTCIARKRQGNVCLPEAYVVSQEDASRCPQNGAELLHGIALVWTQHDRAHGCRWIDADARCDGGLGPDPSDRSARCSNR